MLRHGTLTLLLLLTPTVAWAQKGPERLLPAGSQVYLQWDGFGAHREAFDKTALGKTMKGDTGKFLTALWNYTLETLETVSAQADPNAPEMIKEVNKVLSTLCENGFAVGLEVRRVAPADVQGVLVFPKSAPTLMPLVKKITAMAKGNIKENKVGERTVYSVSAGPVLVEWWAEGTDAVLAIGTGRPGDYAIRIDDRETGLAANPVFKKVSGFKEFPIWARGYLDLDGVWKLAAAASPQAGEIIDKLGLKGLNNITFVSGFDGPAERSITDFNMTGERKGLLALLNKKTFTLADLPPMPSDLRSFSASNFNVNNLYEGGVQIAEVLAKVFAPQAGDDVVRNAIKQIEGIAGISFGEDLFGSFDGMSVSYSSGSEGFLTFGSVLMLKVKNEKKLTESLDTIFKAIPALPGMEVSYTKKNYRGVPIQRLHFSANQIETNLGYFTIHKGWFLYSNTPQPLYGYVLRGKEELPTWKADAKLLKQLEAFPKEFTAISVSDPRPAVEFLLAATPTVFSITNIFATQLGKLAPGAPDLKAFDISVIPHAKDATRHLFPNISVTTDDGKRIRTDTRASLAIPFLN